MKEYEVDVNGVPTTMLLDEDVAKELGAKPVQSKAAPAPKNKAAKTAPTKAD